MNDDQGSYDLDMTRERLARIRMKEDKDCSRILGVPITGSSFYDGML